jgi:hypothetical protein
MRLINRENFEKIKPGMTENEVEALLGSAPGNYASKPVEWEEDSPFEEAMRSWWHCKEWIDDEGVIQVRFGDMTGKVLSADFREVYLPQDSFFGRVRSWLRI